MIEKRGLLAVGAGLALLFLTACTALPVPFDPTHTAAGGGTGRIAFTAESERVRDLFTIHPDGTNLVQLTDNIDAEWYPTWSPDGTKIAFTSYDGQRTEIYVMHADGSNRVRLTDNPTLEGTLAWSPDGKQIAFTSNRNDPDLANCNNTSAGCITNIFVMDVESLEETQLTPSDLSYEGPAWSPDGKRIAFSSNRGGRDIFVMNADGSGRQRLDGAPSFDWSPAWSPDGKKIAFMSNRDFENYQIFVMDADGTNVTRVTAGVTDASAPRWSPDGKRIVLYVWEGENTLLCTLDPDGQNLACMDHMDSLFAKPFFPVWQPRR